MKFVDFLMFRKLSTGCPRNLNKGTFVSDGAPRRRKHGKCKKKPHQEQIPGKLFVCYLKNQEQKCYTMEHRRINGKYKKYSSWTTYGNYLFFCFKN
jgi:hypothetical protein